MRNTAVAVNFRDVLMRRGLHAVKSFPVRPRPRERGRGRGGRAGRDGLRGRRPRRLCGGAGRRLCGGAQSCRRRALIALPDGIDERTAAAMMIRGMTARYLLHDTYKVKPGDTILIHAAAGGVGLIMCQWAKHLGATVIGTVGSDEKAAVARAHGCDHADRLHAGGFRRARAEITNGEGVPVVYDSVGKTTFEGSLRCLRRRGVLASFGEASGDPDPMPPRRLGQLGSIYLTHPSLSNYTATRAELLETANDLFAMVQSGKITIEISQRYPLRDAPLAHADLEARKTTGSIVLVV